MARPSLVSRVATAWSALRSAWLSSAGLSIGGKGEYYASNDPTRGIIDRTKFRPRTRSADQALVPSLQQLVADLRALDCRSPLIRAGVDGLRAELVGTGIGIQPNTGDADLDRDILEIYELWADQAQTDGGSLYGWQWTSAGEFVTAGAVLARWTSVPAEDSGGLPRERLLPLDVEWFSPLPVAAIGEGNAFVWGKEYNRAGKFIAAHLRDPENPSRTERVPAGDIIHVYLPRRMRGAHGEPMAAPLIERALNDDEIVLNELASGRAAAELSGWIESQSGDNEDPAVLAQRLVAVEAAIAQAQKASSYSVNGRSVTNAPLESLYRQRELILSKTRSATEDTTSLPAGTFKRLGTGEKAVIAENKRPSSSVAEFRNTIRQDHAAVLGLPLYWFDADASKANYTSLREAGQKTKRRLAPLHQITGRQMAGEIYLRVLPSILLILGKPLPASALACRRLFRYHLRPDVPGYVDPAKDATAAMNAVAGNLMTLEEAVAERGRNLDDVLKRRAEENRTLKELGLPLPGQQIITQQMAPPPPATPPAEGTP